MCPVLHMARCTNVATFESCPFTPKSCGGIIKDDLNIVPNINDEIVKKQENEVRKKVFKIRMNDAEIKMVRKYKEQTTERSLSGYMRKVSMQKPVTIKYRNQSADDFLKEMLGLKKELNAIGNNFNQAVHKLHLLDKIPEFRVWINHYESVQQSLVSKVEEIKLKVSKLYEEWLQK